MRTNNRQAIEQLSQVLASGLRSHTVDGQTTQYADRRAIIAEIERLKREDTENGYTTKRRIRTIRLGGY